MSTEQAAAAATIAVAPVTAAPIAMAAVMAAMTAAAVVAAAGSFIAAVAATQVEQVERKRLGCNTHQAGSQSRHKSTILHRRAPQNGTHGDGNGNNMSPEPPAPRCSRCLRQAETLSFSDQVS